jgi:hypothetical protein
MKRAILVASERLLSDALRSVEAHFDVVKTLSGSLNEWKQSALELLKDGDLQCVVAPQDDSDALSWVDRYLSVLGSDYLRLWILPHLFTPSFKEGWGKPLPFSASDKPVLVYTPAKAGTHTITDKISASELGYKPIPFHWCREEPSEFQKDRLLLDMELGRYDAKIRTLKDFAVYRMESFLISRSIESIRIQSPDSRIPSIVTFRDPIAAAISYFFQRNPNPKHRFSHELLKKVEVDLGLESTGNASLTLRDSGILNYYLQWFESEPARVLSLSLSDMASSRPYQLIKRGAFDIGFIRLEQFHKLNDLLKEMLGIDQPQISHQYATALKNCGSLYEFCRSEIRLPTPFLKNFYAKSPLNKIYSAQETDSFVRRWESGKGETTIDLEAKWLEKTAMLEQMNRFPNNADLGQLEWFRLRRTGESLKKAPWEALIPGIYKWIEQGHIEFARDVVRSIPQVSAFKLDRLLLESMLGDSHSDKNLQLLEEPLLLISAPSISLNHEERVVQIKAMKAVKELEAQELNLSILQVNLPQRNLDPDPTLQNDSLSSENATSLSVQQLIQISMQTMNTTHGKYLVLYKEELSITRSLLRFLSKLMSLEFDSAAFSATERNEEQTYNIRYSNIDLLLIRVEWWIEKVTFLPEIPWRNQDSEATLWGFLQQEGQFFSGVHIRGLLFREVAEGLVDHQLPFSESQDQSPSSYKTIHENYIQRFQKYIGKHRSLPAIVSNLRLLN